MDGPIYHWGIYTYWLKSTTRRVLKGPCLFLGGELSVHLLLGLQHVPLSDGSPGVGQHVGPMAQLRPQAVEAHKDFADGIVLADLVIVQNGYNNLHFLWRGKSKRSYRYTNKSQCHRHFVGYMLLKPSLHWWHTSNNFGFIFVLCFIKLNLIIIIKTLVRLVPKTAHSDITKGIAPFTVSDSLQEPFSLSRLLL